MLFDTHCHYNLSPLKEHWKDHWRRAQNYGITGSIVVGTDYETSRSACAIAQAEPALFAAVGTHPENYHALVSQWLQGSWNEEREFDGVILQDVEQAKLLIDEQVVAIGEVGLDYYRLPESGKERSMTIALQQESFAAHLELAIENSLPSIVHIRDHSASAYFDALDILRDRSQADSAIILHCISGPPEYLKEALELGVYVGVAANCTYPKAEHIRSLVSIVPPERLLLETDAPYLPPQEFRGKTCEPWMISQTAQFLEAELNIDLAQCYQNSLAAFGLEAPVIASADEQLGVTR
jgi:TatD DNase family protein